MSETIDWSGKGINDIDDMKSKFRTWMKRQKKSDGESYSPKTITAYINALKNSTIKLDLGDEVFSNLFYYITLDEFEKAHQKILNAPNFDSVDKTAGNKSYSNGMVLYKKFLSEWDEPSCWIFQGNPKYYDVVGAVEAEDTLTWTVNQYSKQIKKGDKAYIWLSGSDSGIVASGTIMHDPELKTPNFQDPYTRGEFLKNDPYLAVEIQVKRKFIQFRVPRAVLLADERTKQLEILKYPGATNFRVTKAQDEVIESIINGNYERFPIVDTPQVEVVGKQRYWLYAPGTNAHMWDEFYKEGIMGIGWDDVGDLTQFKSKEDIKNALRQKYDSDKPYKHPGLELWQFANDISIGDIIFVKKGISLVLGCGVVESDYFFDAEHDEYKNRRKVNWTHKGEWEHPGNAVSKLLTDITPFTEYVEELKVLVFEEEEIDDEPETKYTDYSENDFLNEVYVGAGQYATLKSLLLRKKNIILQGAPGVGKTYIAQRLAFSIMGEKDTSRVKVVQFHQSYSYEDFVMGYRPDGSGFNVKDGPFYNFCKDAKNDDEREYFFIIDEINRGNLSKIFGELLMLIEGDKRGEGNAIRLLYKDEQFFVPPNVYIIGMMNTADRSLALIDYALRRRFAFYEMEPAFSSEGFRNYQTTIQNSKFDVLIKIVEDLNKEISEDTSLGKGFRIGHSYFCTSDIVNDSWLSDVVEYELLPLLNEYWFDEPTKVDLWSRRLRGVIRG